MEKITSEQNQWLKKITALKNKKYREEYSQFVIEGYRFCEEALKNKANLEVLLISEDALEAANIKELLAKYLPKYYIVESKLLAKNLSTITPQGIAAIINKPNWVTYQGIEKDLVLIVDGVQDPGNLGTIIRTALGAEAGCVFCMKGTVDLYNEKTLRSTMGAIFNLPVYYIEEKETLLTILEKFGFKIVLADVNTDLYHFQCNYPEKVALVLGNEAKGPLNFKQGNFKVKIPLNPKVESLNVAVAAGIILYEINRQRMV